jgi:hypothetical protein
MRSSIVSVVLGLIPAIIGCGGDDNPAPDAPTTMTPTFKGYDADEGGEIRIEHLRFNATTNGTRIVAYVYGNPGGTKYFPFPSLMGCTDMTMKKNWPMATNPVADRVYLDPGEIIISSPTSTTNAAPKPALTLPRVDMQGPDFLARVHPANKWFFYFNPMDGDKFLTPNAFLDVILTGSADMPGQVFHNVAWMPNDFQLTTPALADGVVLKAGQAQTFKWALPPQDKPADMTIISLVAFVGSGASDDGPAILCVQPDVGEMTVPANFVDIVRTKYPQGGLLARQTFTHVPKELVDKTGPTGRRLDMISTWCFATPYMVQ